MARIRCHYLDCKFLDDGYCDAGLVEIDPAEGCMTYARNDELVAEDWSDEEEDVEEWEDAELEEDEEELWIEEDEF